MSFFIEYFKENDKNNPWYPEMPCWEAYKGIRRFSAISPVELLGLVALWETRGDKWQTKKDEPRLREELIKNSKTN